MHCVHIVLCFRWLANTIDWQASVADKLARPILIARARYICFVGETYWVRQRFDVLQFSAKVPFCCI